MKTFTLPQKVILTIALLIANFILAFFTYKAMHYEIEVRFFAEIAKGGSISAFYQEFYHGPRWQEKKIVTSKHLLPNKPQEVVLKLPVHKMRYLRLDVNHDGPGNVIFHGIEINGNQFIGPSDLKIISTNDLLFTNSPNMGRLEVNAGAYDPYLVLKLKRLVTGKGAIHSNIILCIFIVSGLLCFFPFFPALGSCLRPPAKRIHDFFDRHAKAALITTGILKLATAILICLSDIKLFPLLLAEIIFLVILFRLFKWKMKILLFILLIICVLQMINIFATGKSIETETLMNLQEANTFSLQFKLKLYLLLAWILILFIPDMVIKPFSLSKKILKYAVFLLFIIAEFIFCLPVFNFGQAVNKIIVLLQVPPANLTTGELYFRKNIPNSGISSKLKSSGKNIILLFSEGMSFECISSELTPNIYNLQKTSISFRNYYNHTAATFRGIRGQLISGYPMIGGVQAINLPQYSDLNAAQISRKLKENPPDFPTLPTILNKHNYRTVFISPHDLNEKLGIMAQAAGFQKVLHSTDHVRNSIMLTDRQIYDFIWNELENCGKSEQPFMLSAYILGTHHGFDSPDIRFKDGTEPLLNKFHNQDHWFGEFFKKLKNSKHYENTILILTSDHAIYPIPAVRKIFKIDTPDFIGKIPLFIHHNTFQPQVLDAQRRNSLALTPTILDLLNIHEERNYFLGNSLFLSTPGEFERVAAQGKDIHLTLENGVVKRCEKMPYAVQQKWKKKISEYYRFIQ